MNLFNLKDFAATMTELFDGDFLRVS